MNEPQPEYEPVLTEKIEINNNNYLDKDDILKLFDNDKEDDEDYLPTGKIYNKFNFL